MKKIILFILLLSITKAFCQVTESSSDAKTFNISKKKETSTDANIMLISKNKIDVYVKKYVEDSIAIWDKKGKTEKSDVYRTRMQTKRQAKTDLLIATALGKLEKEKIASTVWKFNGTENYDADAETYLLSVGSDFLNIILNVPASEVNIFDKAFQSDKLVITNPDLAYDGKQWQIKSFTVVNKLNSKKINYNSLTAGTYNTNTFDIKIEDLNVVVNREDIGGGKIIEKEVIADVDLNIPVTTEKSPMIFAVVIGNETYTKEIKVKYAIKDAKIFKEYLQKTLGVPVANIHYLENGTYGQILGELTWINGVIKAYQGQAKVIFYYAGHGMPDEKTKSAFLLPVDGNSQNTATAVKLTEIYSKLTEFPSSSVTVFLDACFSGAARDNAMLSEGRGVKIKTMNDLLPGNLVVFSAATGDETAFPYAEKQHGLFTYYLLKKIKETKGNVSFEDLGSYIITNVSQQSLLVNNKSQTPQVNTGSEVQDTWKSLKLK